MSLTCNRKIIETTTILCSSETLILNSVNKTTFSNGMNRNCFTVKIPKNTKFLIVRVLVDNSENQAKFNSSIDLINSIALSGIDSNLKLVGGMTVLALMPPSTGKYCDFFVFPDRKNFDGFMEKGVLMNWADNWISLPEPYKKLNTQSFSLAIDINDLSDKHYIYLGFLNHNLTNACKIFLDIIAVK